MKLSNVTKTLIAPIALLGASACTNLNTADKVKEDAVKYLSGTELLRAEKIVTKQPADFNQMETSRVAYWDSLITAYKAEEAYFLGQQMIKDSIAGKPYKKQQYKIPIDTIYSKQKGSNLRKTLINECANYCTAEEFIKLIEKEPPLNDRFFKVDDDPTTVHYWSLISRAGKEQEAFNKGISDTRKKLNN